MGKIVPPAIEAYLAALNRTRDPWLEEVARTAKAEGLPIVDAEVGLLLRVLATAIGARHVLELGTAVGYSGLWLARTLPADGHLFTFEIDPARAAVAVEHFARAGVGDRVHVLLGDAARLLNKVSGPFDLVFQDGDKHQYRVVLDRLIALLRPGGVLVTDNVLWDGEVVPGYVAAPGRDPETTRTIAAFNQRLVSDPRLLTTVLPLRDGVAVSVKLAD